MNQQQLNEKISNIEASGSPDAAHRIQTLRGQYEAQKRERLQAIRDEPVAE